MTEPKFKVGDKVWWNGLVGAITYVYPNKTCDVKFMVRVPKNELEIIAPQPEKEVKE